MDIREAIRIHLQWKVELEWMLCGKQPLEPQRLAQVDACEFGRWLHGEARSLYGEAPALQQAVQEHARFHAVCSEVADCIQDGRREQAARLLSPGGDFSRASHAIVEALDDLARLTSHPQV